MPDSDRRPPSSAPADPKAIQQQVRAIVQNLDHLQRSEAYWQISSVVGGVRGT